MGIFCARRAVPREISVSLMGPEDEAAQFERAIKESLLMAPQPIPVIRQRPRFEEYRGGIPWTPPDSPMHSN